jgi:hypothetical protein
MENILGRKNITSAKMMLGKMKMEYSLITVKNVAV